MVGGVGLEPTMPQSHGVTVRCVTNSAHPPLKATLRSVNRISIYPPTFALGGGAGRRIRTYDNGVCFPPFQSRVRLPLRQTCIYGAKTWCRSKRSTRMRRRWAPTLLAYCVLAISTRERLFCFRYRLLVSIKDQQTNVLGWNEVSNLVV